MTGPAPLGSAPGRSATAFAVAPLRVGFVGSGRAATALARGLRSAGAGHDLLFARRGEPARRLAAEVGGEVADPLEVLGQADVTILAVPDDALAGLVGNLAEALDGLAMSAGAGGALAPNPAAPMVPPTTSSGP
ncbi:MAG TPA: NAD(P)-binding domain-containing protein, partial [Candidatus Dormibacteraeota bacterium]|nr:NAD(P)-binding domain-containing protein [Candidatus Dormibacteraeota bacterium]